MSRRRGLGAAVAFVVCWLHFTPEALATFRNTVVASQTVTAHRLMTPTLNCGALGVLSAQLTWTPTADASQPDIYGSGFLADGYELLRSSAPGGPYSPVVSTTQTSHTMSLSAGTTYYVVRTFKHGWKGVVSNERRVVAVAFLLATCS